jgi:hypothetical protein
VIRVNMFDQNYRAVDHKTGPGDHKAGPKR